ncbi:hypothetical protein [Niabella aquatica]
MASGAMVDEVVTVDDGQKDGVAAWGVMVRAGIYGGDDISYDDILLYDAFRAFCAYIFYNAPYEVDAAFFVKMHLLQLK